MRRADPIVFPTLLCVAIFVAGAGGVAAGAHLQRLGDSSQRNASRSSPVSLFVAAAQAQQTYRFIDDKPKLDAIQPPDVAAPKFSRIIIEKTGVSRLEGDGTPGSQVLIKSAGRMIAAAIVDPEGRWAVTLDKDLEAGDHAITSVAAGRETTQSGDEVRVFIPEDFRGREIVAYDRSRADQGSAIGAAATEPASTVERAQELAAAASEKFSEVVPPRDETPDLAPAAKSAPEAPVSEAPAPARKRPGIDIATPVAGWFERASEAYKNEVSGKLAVPTASEPPASEVAQNSQTQAPTSADKPADKSGEPQAAPAAPADGQPADFLSSGAAAVRQWMKDSGETYDREIAGPLSVPTETGVATDTMPKDKSARDNAPAIKAARPSVDTSGNSADAARKIQLERERADKAWRDAQSREEADTKTTAEKARQAEDAKRRQAEDAAAKARDTERASAEQSRKAAEAKRIVEGMKRLEAAQRAEEGRKAAQANTPPRDDGKSAGREPDVAAAEDVPPSKRLEFTIDEEDKGKEDAREDDNDLRGINRPTSDGGTKRQRQAMLEERRSNKNARVGGWRSRNDYDARYARSCSAGTLRRGGRKNMIYIVQPGDTLWAIANRHYRHGSRYNIIYRANQDQLPSADLIRPCQRLVLPGRGKKRHA
jgi:nucleoid-associated protein YgaU